MSYLNKKQLEDFNYSDTYVKFKVKNLMKENGIRGPKNGRRWDDPTKWAHHSIKVEPHKREITRNVKPVYESEQSFIFDSRSEREVYHDTAQKGGYLNKIYDSVL